MTDNSGISWARSAARSPLPVFVAGLSVLLASTTAALLAFNDPADAATVVTSATRAEVVLPSGVQHAAVVGERLPSGAVIRTAAKGGARLTAAGRDVYVGALSTVRVLDGVHEALERGQVMVDSRDGAQLRLDVDGGWVLLAKDTLARVERSAVLRVGVFSGASAVGVDGRQVSTKVPALRQVTQQYGALPATPTALYLVKDPWERRLAADLTSNDDQLERLQKGLRGTDGTVVLASARTELLDAVTDVTATSDQGERALSIAVAEVGVLSSSPVTNLSTVRTARTEGGSWGVVAAIVQASLNDVTGALSGSLDSPGQPVQAIGDPGAGPVLPGSSPTPAPTDVIVTAAPPTSGPPTTAPPTTTPPSTPPGTVEQLVNTITQLLPTPPPSPLAPLPSPSLQVGPITIG